MVAKKTRKTKTPEAPKPPEPYKEEMVTFCRPNLKSSFAAVQALDEPSCFNGDVRVRKYKVTVELIDEPIEVIHERLLNLWETCDNHHHWTYLRHEAARYGLELTSDRRGIRRPKRSW